MLEEHRLDVQLVGRELVEDVLSVVASVVVANAGVVPADDEVRAAVVLAADRVPDRLPRPGVAHRRREGREEHTCVRVVAVEQGAVAVDSHADRYVVRLRLADERMDEEPVHGLECDFCEVLVRTMDRIPSLKADDALPPALGEDPPRLGGVARQLGELCLRALENRHAAGQVERLLAVETGDARVRLVGRSEAELGLALPVVLVDFLDVEDGDGTTCLIHERDAVTRRRGIDRKADRKRPRQPACEVHLLDDPLVVGSPHEPLERRERTRGEHVEVGELSRRERDLIERLEIVGALPRSVDEAAAVRRDQPLGRGNRHAVTPAGINPSSSSFSMTNAADCSGVSPSVSTTISGEAGASYGSSTPVKPVISPANAFA